MANIIPDSEIQFFTDVGLSPSYEDTRYFPDTASKDSFFNSLPKAGVSSCTYVRENRNRVRVQLPMQTMYNRQYMRFKNTSFVDKWFYAFIIQVEYINNITTEVVYQMDYIMTWMGSFTLGQCYIERQHSTTDVIGDNIIEENLEIGDYVYQQIERTGYLNVSYQIIIGASVDQQGQSAAGGQMINGVYSGIFLHNFGTVQAANAFIEDLTGDAASTALVGAVMMPSGFAPSEGSVAPAKLVTIQKNIYNLDGYTPRNKKLFTYPYNFLAVTNGDGNVAIFRYEFFNTSASIGANQCAFYLYGQPDLQPEFILEPIQYKTSATNQFATLDKLSLKGFPQCAFNIDQYKAFLAQNSSSLQAEVISTAGSGVLGAVVGAVSGNLLGVVSAGLSAGSQIMQRSAQLHDYAKKPAQANGMTTGSIEAGRQLKDFYFYKECITQQYARILDKFFDMFGYAQNTVATPNMAARPSWTYVKTIGCVVHCSAPAEDVREIEAAFDRGIRFWKSGVTIGNYGASNAV